MKILLVTTNMPVPHSRNGNAQRTTLLLQALQRFGEVDLFIVAGRKLLESEAFARFQADPAFSVAGTARIRYGRRAKPWSTWGRLLPGPLGGGLASVLARQKGTYLPDDDTRDWLLQKTADGTYGLVVSRYLRTALFAGMDAVTQAPTLVDVDDIDWRLLESVLQDSPWPGRSGRLGGRIALLQLESFCRRALRRFDHVWTASTEDTENLGLPHCSALPNIPYPWPSSGARERVGQEPARLLFIGEMGWEPNRNGVNRFLEQIWPRVREACPEAVFEIVGQNLTPEWRERWGAQPGVLPTGFVDDLDEAYAKATFTVAPIYQGAGTNIKVLESLAQGRTCATTDHGLRGLREHLRHRESVWRAGSDEEFAQGCISLIRDPALRKGMETTGRDVIRQHFAPEVFSRAVHEAVEAVLAKRSSKAPSRPRVLTD